MTTLLRTAVATLALALLTLAAPATGHDTRGPHVDMPLRTWDSGVTPIQIEGPRNIWGLRPFAKQVAHDVRGVHVRVRGTCAQRPNFNCVKIVVGDYGPTDWYALHYWDSSSKRRIYLNSYYRKEHPRPTAIVRHEFGHALGLSHHKRHGVVGGWANETKLSPAEKRALRRHY